MHIAILLRGHIRRKESANSFFNHEFIYTKTINSFKKNIIESIEKLDKKYSITYDLYGSVKGSHDETDNQNFIKDYLFKEYKFNDGTTQFDDILIGLEMILKSGVKYDLIMVTRVDFLYKKKFEELEYDKDKFNFCWKEPISEVWVCDNMYIFGKKYLDTLIKIYNINRKRFREKAFGQCIIPGIIIRELGQDNINYMFKDKYYSCTNWNHKCCNNPLYIIYGYDYHYDKIYD